MPTPFGEVQTFDIEVDEEGKEIRHRAAAGADLTPYAEWIKENRAEYPDKKLGLVFPTGPIFAAGDKYASKSNIGVRGQEEWKHAKAFERAAKEVLGLGQPKIEYFHDVPEPGKTLLKMRFHEKRTFDPQTTANRQEGQARGRVKRANTRVKDLRAQLEADPNDEDLQAALKLANARLTSARKAFKELTGNGK